ncbi:MAG: translocation/assembly module TamB domain-containing protein, partial [Candidatus Aminicenantes bacterium]|nr:translocation/assembly module TamB domain-containing protein [Candidatus Aminicenantes bacterium]
SAAEGILSAEFKLSGDTGRLDYEAELTSAGARYGRLGEVALAAKAAGNFASVRVSGLEIRTAAGSVKGAFTADLKRPSLAGVALEWTDLDPDRVLPLVFPGAASLPSLGSLVSGRFDGRAEPISPRGIEGLAWLRLVPGPADEMSPAGRRLLRPSGQVDLSAARGEVAVAAARLDAAGVALSAEGRVGLGGDIEGRFSARADDLRGTLDELRSAGLAVPAGPRAAFDPEALTGALSLSGTVRGRRGDLDVSARLEGAGLGYRGMEGNLLAETRIVKKPEGFEGSLSGRASVEDLAGLGRAGLEIEAGVAPGRFDVASFELRSGPGSLTGRGRLDLARRTFAASLHGEGIRLEPFRSLLPPGSEPGGALEIRLEAEGAMAAPRGTLVLAVEQARFGSISASAVEVEAETDGGSAEIGFSGTGLTFGAAGAPPEAGPAANPVADIEGRLRASGDLSDPDGLAAELEISRLAVAVGPQELSNPEPLRIGLDKGTVRVESLRLTGGAGEVSVSGTAGPVGGPAAVEGRIVADIDAAAFAPFLPGLLVGGRLRSDIAAGGRLDDPSLSGEISLENAYVRPEDFPLVLSGLSAVVSLDGSRLSIERFEGTANGSPLEVGGGLEGLLSSAPLSGRVTVEARSLALNYPPGLLTSSDIALALTGEGSDWTLGGRMTILQGLFREDISVGGRILGFGSYRWTASESELPAFVRDIRLDISVETAEPIVISNNLAEVALSADLRVAGNPGLPLFSGRLRNAGVGEIVFNERRFTLETLRLDLLGQRVPDPQIEIVAHAGITHNIEPLDVDLRLYGRSSDLRYSLTSTPPRSKEDLSLILLTGRSLEEVRGNAIDTLATQTVQFFSSPIASPVTRALERALGVEDVSIEPLLISSETDPGARLTLRKKISDAAALTYSIDITSTQDQTLVLSYKVRKNVSLQAFRRDNGSYGASVRHSIPIRLGPGRDAAPDPGGASRPVITGVSLEGEPLLPERTVKDALGRLREGRPFLYARLRDAVDRLIRAYKERGFVNAGVRSAVSTSEDGSRAEVGIALSPGRPARFDYRGDRVPARVRRAVRRAWTGLLPESVNLDESRRLILERLRKKRFYQAEVEAVKIGNGGETVYRITVAKGPRYRFGHLEVEGNRALSTEEIGGAADGYPQAAYKGLWNLVFDQRAAVDAIRNAYRRIGHSETKIGAPLIETDPAARTVGVRLSVEEGPRRTVRNVAFEGNASLSDGELGEVIEIAEGAPYDPGLVPREENSVLAFYRSRGHQEAEIKLDALPTPNGSGVDLVFTVHEGPVYKVGGLLVRGARRSREGLILKTARIDEGDVFSFESLAMGQKRLYDLGVYHAVDISARDAEAKGPEVPVTLDVTEEPPLTLTYAARYNSEDGLEGQAELALVNLLGRGRTGFLSYRRSAKLWDARLSVKFPYLLGLRGDTRFTLSASRERREAYISEELAGSAGYDARVFGEFDMSLDYRLSRVREKEPDAALFGPPAVLSELSLGVVRDRRDDRFDPRDGSFLSLGLTGAPKVFGSEKPYGKIFAQFSTYRGLGKGVSWASNLRLGAAAFRDVPLASRLFYAGGGTSIRGFAQDRVGPIDPVTGLPAGGRFVLLVNQELRVPLFWIFRGVVFYDAGNVYESFGDLTRLALRQGIGLGLRAQSPVGLVRFDCGFNPFRRPGESAVA